MACGRDVACDLAVGEVNISAVTHDAADGAAAADVATIDDDVLQLAVGLVALDNFIITDIAEETAVGVIAVADGKAGDGIVVTVVVAAELIAAISDGCPIRHSAEVDGLCLLEPVAVVIIAIAHEVAQRLKVGAVSDEERVGLGTAAAPADRRQWGECDDHSMNAIFITRSISGRLISSHQYIIQCDGTSTRTIIVCFVF